MIINQIAQGGSGSQTKYGASGDTFLGDIDANGVLQNATTATDLTFTGVTGIAAVTPTMGVLFRRFQNLQSIRKVSFPALASITTPSAMSYCFYGTSITELDLSNLTTINGEAALTYVCYNSPNLASLKIGKLASVFGKQALYYAFSGCSSLTGALDLTWVTPSTVSGIQVMSHAFEGTGITSVDFSGWTGEMNSPSQGFQAMFKDCKSLTSADLSNITRVSNATVGSMFSGCSALVNVDVHNFEKSYAAMAEMFSGCSALTSIDLNKLEIVSDSNGFSNVFQGCTSLVDVGLKNLKTIQGNQCANNAFKGCTALETLKLPSLDTLTNGSLLMRGFCSGCTSLKNMYFYALKPASFNNTNVFDNMLLGVTGCTVHFPMSVQSTIGSWTSVTGGFDGTNTIVLFDIVQTLTGADTNSYVRSEKDSTSTANAWLYNSTLYYTSGTTEPQVGDTIYSDSACTTAVTTISAIA